MDGPVVGLLLRSSKQGESTSLEHHGEAQRLMHRETVDHVPVQHICPMRAAVLPSSTLPRDTTAARM
jgi:hypothetical protein